MRNRIAIGAALLALWLPLPASAQLEPPGTGGTQALDLALRRLGHVTRVLVIGAHPDDEDTELIALLARGQGAQVAYLSLTRGEGGQNLIGEELGIGLGLLRTEELLAARRIDGARQFFTRAYDFGYSRSAEEAFRFWPREEVLRDVVRVIRRFRPQVVVSIFPPGGGGHGQHRAAGTLAYEAFRAAGDSTRFPELSTAEGLRSHAPQKLYRSARFDREAATLTLESGALDPVLGRSYHQIAMASRSQHRSQDQGRLQEPGPSQVHLALVEDRTGRGADGLFAGVDTMLAGPAGSRPPDPVARFGRLVDSVRASLDLRAPDRIVPQLARAVRELRDGLAPHLASTSVGPLENTASRPPWVSTLAEQGGWAEEALASAAGVVLDALVEDERITPGQEFEVRVVVWNAGRHKVVLRGARLGPAFRGVRIVANSSAQQVEPGGLAELVLQARAPEDGAPTRPYFLEKPLSNGMYDWSDARPEVRGLPFEPSPFTVVMELEIEGVRVELEREAVYHYRDQAIGEVRRPAHFVPALGVRMEPALLVWPVDSREPRSVTVTVTNYGKGSAEGELRLEVPAGWAPPPAHRFRLEREDETRTFTFSLRLPRGVRPDEGHVAAVARTPDGREERVGVLTIDYPHIRPRFGVEGAVTAIHTAEIALPRLSRIGYVRGAADGVPEALRAIGLPVALLSDSALRAADLDRYDVIVIGSRAYETNPTLAAENGRLLEYVRRGGTLLVQYQQYQFVRGRYAPYPLEIARPHDRVTDERAAPELLAPGHALFRSPNRIGPADWEGWVQERGLYFPREWDERYVPLVAFADPGASPQRGALLVARVGGGTYVYTGLSFFRQLPAGVPGAYRLFANLLALGGGRGS